MLAMRQKNQRRLVLHRPERFDRTRIAELTPDAIVKMTDAELARVVRSAHLGFLSAADSAHIGLKDRDTLERLTYLARRCCRNQLEQDAPVEFAEEF